MRIRYGLGALLAVFACTPVERASAPREAAEQPATVAVPRVMIALPESAARMQRRFGPPREGNEHPSPRGRWAETEWGEPLPEDPLFACDHDDDCTIVQLDLCDELNGGWILSVRKDRVHEANGRWAITSDRQRCTAMNSLTEVYPQCVAGACMRGYRSKAHARRVREELSPRDEGPDVYRTMVPNHVPPR